MTEREFAIDVVKRLQSAGHQALWAGGCVRDELLGLVPKDYDVATDAPPDVVRRLFRRTVAVGAAFGVVEVIGPRVDGEHLIVQVATFRSDLGYSDGRRPDAVVFSSPQDDALRRDFTINGMFFDPIKEELIDYVGGQDDLHHRILRAIGDPRQRFAEDKLRLLRAIRIATRFDLTIEPETAAAIRAMADQITVVSAERIADELRKLLVERHRARGVQLLDELGLIKPLLPEMLPLKNTPHREGQVGHDTLWVHIGKVLAQLGDSASFPLALAALLHETGQPAQRAARLAAEIADRLKLANAEKDRTAWLIENQNGLRDAPSLPGSVLKKLLAHPGIRNLLTLHRAEALANGESTAHVEFCESRLATWTENDLNPPPLVNGNDLKMAGLKPGPRFKEILDAVRDAQLDGTITAREEALALARELMER